MNRSTFIKTLGVTMAGMSIVPWSTWAEHMGKKDGDEERMPVLFVGHGSPMNAIDQNAFTASLEKLGQTLPTPQAILVISAHWMTNGTWVQALPKPPMVYDMYGFPEALYKVDYPAPGAPELAKELTEKVSYTQVIEDHSWGYDHGNWAVLCRMYPKADIPVFQLSLDMSQPPAYHAQLGAQLAYLRYKGVLVVGSGNIVHNLGRLKWGQADSMPYDWTLEFDGYIKNALDNFEHHKLINYQDMGSVAKLAHPTPDHYYPLLYSAALRHKDDTLSYPYEGLDMGSISMRSVLMG